MPHVHGAHVRPSACLSRDPHASSAVGSLSAVTRSKAAPVDTPKDAGRLGNEGSVLADNALNPFHPYLIPRVKNDFVRKHETVICEASSKSRKVAVIIENCTAHLDWTHLLYEFFPAETPKRLGKNTS